MRIINKKEVKQIINIKDTLEWVEEVFIEHAEGKTVLPQRPNIYVEKHNGNMLFMPALISGSEALGMKVVSVYPDNAKKNMKTIYSVTILNDASSGEPIALIDTEELTAYRTGAITGVATKYLAKKDAKTVSIWGAGVQSKAQLEAVCAVRGIDKIIVFDINEKAREQFIDEMKTILGINIVSGYDEDEALMESDIIITATTSSKPVIKSMNLKKGTFISAIGGSTAQKQEIPEYMVKASTIIVDSRKAAMSDAGDLLIPMSKGIITESYIKGELGDVVTGKIGRKDDDEIILFKTVGLAIQDMAVAHQIYKKALEKGIGVDIDL
jgi:alanine dehydrogenase